MNKQLTEGIDFYNSPEGLIVFTSAYHLNRGKCCGSGCIHCPYNYENVPEAERNILRNERPAVILLIAHDKETT